MLKHICLAACLLAPACSMGYWPEVTGTIDQTKYQADVRECQTASQSGVSQAVGGAVWLAMASKTDEGRAAIDRCMAARGYTISRR